MTIKKHFKKYNVTIDSNLPNYGLSIDVKKVNELRDRFSVEIDNLLHEKAWDFTWLLALEMSGVDTSKVHWENIEPFLTRQKWRELMVLFDKDDGDDSNYDDVHYCYKILEKLGSLAKSNWLIDCVLFEDGISTLQASLEYAEKSEFDDALETGDYSNLKQCPTNGWYLDKFSDDTKVNIIGKLNLLVCKAVGVDSLLDVTPAIWDVLGDYIPSEGANLADNMIAGTWRMLEQDYRYHPLKEAA